MANSELLELIDIARRVQREAVRLCEIAMVLDESHREPPCSEPTPAPDAPPTNWRIDPLAVHDTARRIAKTAGVIDPRESDDLKAIHEKYELFKHDKSFSEAAEDARAIWIADLIFEMFTK